MTGPAREAFERSVASDPGLANQVRLQAQIDRALGRLFAESPALAGKMAGTAAGRTAGRVAPGVSTGAASPRRLWFRPAIWSVAAVVVIAAALAVYFGVFAGGRSAVLAKVYRDQVAAGFKPQRVCTTVGEFSGWTRAYVGQPLYPPEQHPGVEFVGWSYAPAITKNTPILLARVDGKDVVVVMDRKVKETHELPVPKGDGLSGFRAEIGSAVLYEVTPLDHPAILPLLSTQPAK